MCSDEELMAMISFVSVRTEEVISMFIVCLFVCLFVDSVSGGTEIC